MIDLIESARHKVATAANIAQVYTYYEIGRQIVEEEQGGRSRAEYGRGIIDELSASLTARFGKGWSARNLREIRRFFVEYSSDMIRHDLLAKLEDGDLARASCQIQSGDTVSHAPLFVLGWTHYTILLRVKNRHERFFYEMEARGNGWGTTELGRQIGRQLFERLSISDGGGKNRLLSYIHRKTKPIPASETLKDPYVLDFLGLPERVDYSETELERRIIDHIQEFMLELGNGFFFGGRQVRFSFGDQHFRVDLVFYNRILRCFFVIDLKIGRVSHKDIGQMQMYVHYYDRMVKAADENPTIGILLCSDDNRAVVEMTLPEGEKNQIFARKYSAIIPAKETLERIILDEKAAFEKRRQIGLATPRKKKGGWA